jgi:transcription initiation factor TFIIH subunit 4
MKQLLVETSLMRVKGIKASRNSDVVEIGSDDDVSLSGSKGRSKKRKGITVTITQSPSKSGEAGRGSGSRNNANSAGRQRRLIISHNRKHQITSMGYEFLLQGTHAQIWRFLRRYFDVLNNRNADVISAIGLIFRLGFCSLGKGYPISVLSETQQRMMGQLWDFGLVHLQDVRCKGPGSGKGRSVNQGHICRCFYPTPFGIGLLSSSTPVVEPSHASISHSISHSIALESGSAPSANDSKEVEPVGTKLHQGFSVVVETNFRVYAYTASALHVYMMQLFSNLLYRLPNMVLAVITRESATTAMKSGITASQICRFLSQHAHPDMKEKAGRSGIGSSEVSCLPENVVDQLHLWERERRRVQPSRASLFTFKDLSTCLRAARWAKSKGYSLWSSKTALVVMASHYDECNEYIRTLSLSH